ncbi:mitotic cohesin complex subunit Psm1 [Schizosaccharomyces cryophilus OY26]|uniref:Structural maintenance of chromosomes protein n=1 Tax=Schizosaccharomyces cryophilus (strain OY26 / ATCC MYA-4695 / CBS 11777 / NBRC 106824 / NRRL Y48691) TaxID=653667 RepID=S9VZK6_SCHCR|nr:mitotic cohesin complex subunit Psm1 [Schizosaccharomyces cryophilus OY26]EPY51639.1 mitotic cohesin complex subunit Psm1 [Schizosaccharomyces cryophilus OY26]
MGRLLRLEVENFKSYRGRQTIGPFEDFTSVIGPNGSGKSNLMDAISFVLGVKSSHLRSSNIRELIYRGRVMSSQGSTSFDDSQSPRSAYVKLVYELDDGEEREYKRVITPNGSAEYKINDQPAQFSEYCKSLEDQNILVRARNFLVFQGDVEAIASQSPVDLSRLIEQICGSLEFKGDYEKYKQEQDYAVNLSAHSFNKKRGINAEIKQYQEQKAEAELYESKKEQRDIASLIFLLWKLYHIEKNVHFNTKDIKKIQNSTRELAKRQEASSAKVESLREQEGAIHRQLLLFDRNVRKQEKFIASKRPELISLAEKASESTVNLQKIQRKVGEVEKDYTSQSSTLQMLENQLASLNAAEEQLIRNIHEREKQRIQKLSPEDQKEYDDLRTQADLQNSKTLTELQSLNRKIKVASQARNALAEVVEDLKMRKTQSKEKIHNLTEEKDALITEVNRRIDELESARQSIQQKRANYSHLCQQERDLNDELHVCLQKLLEANADRNESNQDIKKREALYAIKRIYPGIKGRVIDLCSPTQKKYESALVAALGRNFDAIVVESQATAKECIEYIREQRIGVMTFLPMDTIAVKPINQSFRGTHAGARLAIDVVNFEPQYERVVVSALGNTLICDNLNVARDLSYNKRANAKTVTLEGTVIHKTGLITGGSSSTRSAKHWDDREIEQLKQNQNDLISRIDKIQTEKAASLVVEQDTINIHNLESELSLMKESLNAKLRSLEDKRKESDHFNELYRQKKPELESSERELSEMEEYQSELLQQTHEIEDKIFFNFCKRTKITNIRSYEELQRSFTQQYSQKQLEFANQKALLENRLGFERQRTSDIELRLNRLKEFIRKDELSIKEYEQKHEVLETEVATAEAELDLLKEESAETKSKNEEVLRTISQHKLENKRFLAEITKLRNDVTLAESEIERFASDWHAIVRKCKLEDIPLPLSEGSLSNIPIDEFGQNVDTMDIDSDPKTVQAAFGKFGIEVDYEELDDELKGDGSESMGTVLQEKLREYDEELERMSPNMKAMERLEVVEQRLSRLDDEFGEVRKSAKTAKERFNSVKEQRLKKFQEAFNHISEQIDPIYKELTKSPAFPLGGTAYLTLDDSDEPYLGGIRFHAMPPMKRFRDMDQLSGGEKTMAALALLFAIHSYQPSPFFVLDEIDAALDQTNVSKIANYIRQHASNGFQFVVISLKNQLFSKSEALVGIYRDQEQNSSKTLSINLEAYAQ